MQVHLHCVKEQDSNQVQASSIQIQFYIELDQTIEVLPHADTNMHCDEILGLVVLHKPMDLRKSELISLAKQKEEQEEYTSDSEDYERLYQKLYHDSIIAIAKDIETISLDQIRSYLASKPHRVEIAQDLIFTKTSQIQLQEPTPTEDIGFERIVDMIRHHLPQVNAASLIEKLYQWMSEHKRTRSYYNAETLYAPYSQSLDKNMRKQIDFILNLNHLKQATLEPVVVHQQLIVTPDHGLVLTNKGLLPNKLPLLARLNQAKTVEDFRSIEREVGAKAFCDRGYGIPKLRKEIEQLKLNLTITDKRYKAVSTGFSTAAWRRMQKFLKEDCRKPLKIANSNELKVLFTILFNCRDSFKEEESKTFVKFVRLVFQLGQVEINEQQTLKLYSSFMIALQKKLKQTKFNSQESKFFVPKQNKNIALHEIKPDFDKMWTQELQSEFYDAYLKERTLAGVRSYFRIKFYGKSNDKASKDNESNCDGQQLNQIDCNFNDVSKFLRVPVDAEHSVAKCLTNLKVLNSKFHKIIRGGVRRIERYALEHLTQVPRLTKVNDDVIKAMFGSPDAADLRVLIIKIQKQTKQFDKTTVILAIEAMNEFNALKTQERKLSQKSAHPKLEYYPF